VDTQFGNFARSSISLSIIHHGQECEVAQESGGSHFMSSVYWSHWGLLQHKSASQTSQQPANATSVQASSRSNQQASRKVTSTPIESKKRKDLKSKVARQISEGAREDLLGGADYVTLMLGGRRWETIARLCRESRVLMLHFRKAKQEAKKLPPPEKDLSSLSLWIWSSTTRTKLSCHNGHPHSDPLIHWLAVLVPDHSILPSFISTHLQHVL
jgi:hypothetical protein